MNEAKARIIARCIYRGTKNIADYSADEQTVIREQYALLFGKELA